MYNVSKKVKVGTFSEEQLINGEDKVAVKKAQEESGLNYTQTKLTKKKGATYLEIYLISNEDYYNSTDF